MVEIADIKDRDSFRAWLEETNQSREACVWLAHRAAMRVLPYYWQWVATTARAQEINATARPLLHANLISQVAAIVTPAHIEVACRIGADAAMRLARTIESAFKVRVVEKDLDRVHDIAWAAAFTGDIAAYGAASDANSAANAAQSAAAAAFTASDASYAALRADCATLQASNDTPPQTGPALWHTQPNPLEDHWSTVKASLSEDWRFWLDWYQSALDGSETRWDLLTRIALSDPESHADKDPQDPETYDAFWDGSDPEVNARIEAVVDDWKAKQTNTPDINPPTTEQQNAITPLIRLRRISVSDARDLLDRDATLISEKCQMVVEEADSALAYHNLRIPNDPEELRAHNQITAALQLAKVLAMDLHGVVPEPDTPVSEDDASRLSRILKGLEAQLKEVSCYIDDEAHPKTYGRAVKLTSATLVGGLVSIVPGLNAAVAIPAVYACLFGSDSVKAVTALLKSDG